MGGDVRIPAPLYGPEVEMRGGVNYLARNNRHPSYKWWRLRLAWWQVAVAVLSAWLEWAASAGLRWRGGMTIGYRTYKKAFDRLEQVRK